VEATEKTSTVLFHLLSTGNY